MSELGRVNCMSHVPTFNTADLLLLTTLPPNSDWLSSCHMSMNRNFAGLCQCTMFPANRFIRYVMVKMAAILKLMVANSFFSIRDPSWVAPAVLVLTPICTTYLLRYLMPPPNKLTSLVLLWSEDWISCWILALVYPENKTSVTCQLNILVVLQYKTLIST